MTSAAEYDAYAFVAPSDADYEDADPAPPDDGRPLIDLGPSDEVGARADTSRRPRTIWHQDPDMYGLGPLRRAYSDAPTVNIAVSAGEPRRPAAGPAEPARPASTADGGSRRQPAEPADDLERIERITGAVVDAAVRRANDHARARRAAAPPAKFIWTQFGTALGAALGGSGSVLLGIFVIGPYLGGPRDHEATVLSAVVAALATPLLAGFGWALGSALDRCRRAR